MKKTKMFYLTAEELENKIKKHFNLDSLNVGDNLKQKEGYKVFDIQKTTPVTESRLEVFERDGEVPFIIHSLMTKMAQDKVIPMGKYIIGIGKGYDDLEPEFEGFYLYNSDLDKLIIENVPEAHGFSSATNEDGVNLTADIFLVEQKNSINMEIIRNWDANKKLTYKILNMLCSENKIEEGVYVVNYRWEEYTAEQIAQIKSKTDFKPYTQRKVFNHLR